jgi:hypothetical protein
MRAYVTLIVTILWLVLAIPSSALAMTIGYDVKIQNLLLVPAKIEVTQYHSEGFNGTRPKRFTENLKLGAMVVLLQPGESKIVHYNSASGGFWLLWKQLEPHTTAATSGVIELVEGARVINIK